MSRHGSKTEAVGKEVEVGRERKENEERKRTAEGGVGKVWQPLEGSRQQLPGWTSMEHTGTLAHSWALLPHPLPLPALAM